MLAGDDDVHLGIFYIVKSTKVHKYRGYLRRLKSAAGFIPEGIISGLNPVNIMSFT